VALSVLQILVAGAAGSEAAALVGLVAVPQHNVSFLSTNFVHLVVAQLNPGVLAPGALALTQAAESDALVLSSSALAVVSWASLFLASVS